MTYNIKVAAAVPKSGAATHQPHIQHETYTQHTIDPRPQDVFTTITTDISWPLSRNRSNL